MTHTNEELTTLLENLHFLSNDSVTHNYIRLISGISLETITELLEEIEQLMNIKHDVLDELQRLREENAQLKGELPIMPHPKIHRFDLGLEAFSYEEVMLVKPDGKYVLYTDYLWMANYADRLVSFCDLPCLPADLENLSESNLRLATENLALQKTLRSMKTEEK